ncbi:unnamed protein product [Dovyalis caffra]|uniref:Uncharacterized protein n=1 Tax=Dovyalis caffra TaxID=77055 RepID=A0AAV1S145_9ROSI|nr:unnamed protein product [Dovyalis caffra]
MNILLVLLNLEGNELLGFPDLKEKELLLASLKIKGTELLLASLKLEKMEILRGIAQFGGDGYFIGVVDTIN